MALYGATNVSAITPALQNVGTSVRTHLQLAAQTTGLRRAWIYEFDVGPSGQPFSTDGEIAWTVIKQTSAGTGGVALTSNALDTVDAAAASVAIGNIATTEPAGAETGVIFALGANQRASYRWVVAPGGPGELVIPATNVNGLGIRAKSSVYVGTVSVGMLFRE